MANLSGEEESLVKIKDEKIRKHITDLKQFSGVADESSE